MESPSSGTCNRECQQRPDPDCSTAEPSCAGAYFRDGVASDSLLEGGLLPPLPDATTPTLYCVPGSRPSKVAEGVALLTVTAADPPPTGVAVNTKLSQGPPEVGAVASAVPWAGPTASAAVSVGAAGGGITSVSGAEGGVSTPPAPVATTETS